MTLEEKVREDKKLRTGMTVNHIFQGLAYGLGGSLALGILVEQGFELFRPPLSEQDKFTYYTVISSFGAYFGFGFFAKMLHLRSLYYHNKPKP